jgi:hypothetical protein
MKRMFGYIVIIVAVLAVCGFFAVRHAIRTAQVVPPTSDLPQPPQRSEAFDRWQAGLKLDVGGNYKGDKAARDRLLEKLRQEEIRQRPQEGRN